MKAGRLTIPVGPSETEAAWIIDYIWSEPTPATKDEPPSNGRVESYTIKARDIHGILTDMDDHISEITYLVRPDFGRIYDMIAQQERGAE